MLPQFPVILWQAVVHENDGASAVCEGPKSLQIIRLAHSDALTRPVQHSRKAHTQPTNTLHVYEERNVPPCARRLGYLHGCAGEQADRIKRPLTVRPAGKALESYRCAV